MRPSAFPNGVECLRQILKYIVAVPRTRPSATTLRHGRDHRIPSKITHLVGDLSVLHVFVDEAAIDDRAEVDGKPVAGRRIAESFAL
jgi:hypothetical protein